MSWLAWFASTILGPEDGLQHALGTQTDIKTSKGDNTAWDESSLLRDETRPLPWPLFRIGTGMLVLVEIVVSWFIPAPLALTNMTLGYMRSQVLYTVAKLQIAEALASGPLSPAQLALQIGAQPDRLARLMNAAAQIGLFKAIHPRKSSRQPVRYYNTRLSASLREDHPNCIRNLVLHLHDHAEKAWLRLPEGIMTGERMFETAYGKPMFDYLNDNPKEEAKFSRAMSELNHAGVSALMKDFAWGKFARIVDIGGAYGGFLRMILADNKNLQGLIFDQPQVIAEAPAAWEVQPQHLTQRVRFHAGDFFNAESIPKAKNGDAFLMREILHDWDDENALKILQALRIAIGDADAVLVIAENVQLGEVRDMVFNRAVLDLHMMVSLEGAERTREQHMQLLSKAGFRMQPVTCTRCIFSLVTAVPV